MCILYLLLISIFMVLAGYIAIVVRMESSTVVLFSCEHSLSIDGFSFTHKIKSIAFNIFTTVYVWGSSTITTFFLPHIFMHWL